MLKNNIETAQRVFEKPEDVFDDDIKLAKKEGSDLVAEIEYKEISSLATLTSDPC